MASPPRPSIGRIPVVAVGPTLEQGRWPVRAVVGESVPIFASVFRDGHDAVAATVVVTHPDGAKTTLAMPCIDIGMSHYRAQFVPTAEGDYTFRVEGWSDPVATWSHTAQIKLHAGMDVAIVLADGVALFERAASEPGRTEADRAAFATAALTLRNPGIEPEARLGAALTPALMAILTAAPLRDYVSPSDEYPLLVQRERALVSAWYEMFPRSEGATLDPVTHTWKSGTFSTAAKRLPAIAAMGFDILYLTPIHPIGTTFRKGRNNSLDAKPGEPGSPYAIGSADGGHDAIHPDLGTMADFTAFVADARALGMEVALDLALQCSPDHPWVTSHPVWFTTRADGTIAYAENPPKKYQDIFPLNFDNDPEGIYAAVRRVVEVWIDAGVTAFRVDNPHTKPLPFWERLLADVATTRPDVLFLSEAFTRPAMMKTLAKIGFHQSYTYFTWRPTAEALGAYLAEVSAESAYFMRPNFWPTTHDILTPDMQSGGAPLFKARAVLAATGSPSWGIYSGYELVENVARPGVEEQIDNEKYEFKPRDWSQGDKLGITSLLTQLNAARRAHPALQRLRGLTLHHSDNPAILCFSRNVDADQSPTGVADSVIVIASLDPSLPQQATIYCDPGAVGLRGRAEFWVTDALTGKDFIWGEKFSVTLGPKTTMAYIGVVERDKPVVRRAPSRASSEQVGVTKTTAPQKSAGPKKAEPKKPVAKTPGKRAGGANA